MKVTLTRVVVCDESYLNLLTAMAWLRRTFSRTCTSNHHDPDRAALAPSPACCTHSHMQYAMTASYSITRYNLVQHNLCHKPRGHPCSQLSGNKPSARFVDRGSHITFSNSHASRLAA